MQLDQKQQIHKLLIAYLEDNASKNVSQKAAIAMLKDVSEATIIGMRDMKWNNISAEMWRSVGIQLGWRKKRNVFVETLNALTLIMYYTTAKENGEMFAIVAPEGSGKTFTAEGYTEMMRGRHAFYIQCAEYWNKKYFLCEMLKAMGKGYDGLNVYELMDKVVFELSRMDNPVFIFDEVDKLKPEVLLFFITLYNKLHRMCGLVWQSTDTIISTIDKGIRKGKKGFKELFSRIGKSYIELDRINREELEEICIANGITDRSAITVVQNECEGDVRRLDRNYIKSELKKSAGTIKDKLKSITRGQAA